jgi:hypothetical protein
LVLSSFQDSNLAGHGGSPVILAQTNSWGKYWKKDEKWLTKLKYLRLYTAVIARYEIRIKWRTKACHVTLCTVNKRFLVSLFWKWYQHGCHV